MRKNMISKPAAMLAVALLLAVPFVYAPPCAGQGSYDELLQNPALKPSDLEALRTGFQKQKAAEANTMESYPDYPGKAATDYALTKPSESASGNWEIRDSFGEVHRFSTPAEALRFVDVERYAAETKAAWTMYKDMLWEFIQEGYLKINDRLEHEGNPASHVAVVMIKPNGYTVDGKKVVDAAGKELNELQYLNRMSHALGNKYIEAVLRLQNDILTAALQEYNGNTPTLAFTSAYARAGIRGAAKAVLVKGEFDAERFQKILSTVLEDRQVSAIYELSNTYGIKELEVPVGVFLSGELQFAAGFAVRGIHDFGSDFSAAYYGAGKAVALAKSGTTALHRYDPSKPLEEYATLPYIKPSGNAMPYLDNFNTITGRLSGKEVTGQELADAVDALNKVAWAASHRYTSGSIEFSELEKIIETKASKGQSIDDAIYVAGNEEVIISQFKAEGGRLHRKLYSLDLDDFGKLNEKYNQFDRELVNEGRVSLEQLKTGEIPDRLLRAIHDSFREVIAQREAAAREAGTKPLLDDSLLLEARRIALERIEREFHERQTFSAGIVENTVLERGGDLALGDQFNYNDIAINGVKSITTKNGHIKDGIGVLDSLNFEGTEGRLRIVNSEGTSTYEFKVGNDGTYSFYDTSGKSVSPKFDARGIEFRREKLTEQDIQRLSGDAAALEQQRALGTANFNDVSNLRAVAREQIKAGISELEKGNAENGKKHFLDALSTLDNLVNSPEIKNAEWKTYMHEKIDQARGDILRLEPVAGDITGLFSDIRNYVYEYVLQTGPRLDSDLIKNIYPISRTISENEYRRGVSVSKGLQEKLAGVLLSHEEALALANLGKKVGYPSMSISPEADILYDRKVTQHIFTEPLRRQEVVGGLTERGMKTETIDELIRRFTALEGGLSAYAGPKSDIALFYDVLLKDVKAWNGKTFMEALADNMQSYFGITATAEELKGVSSILDSGAYGEKVGDILSNECGSYCRRTGTINIRATFENSVNSFYTVLGTLAHEAGHLGTQRRLKKDFLAEEDTFPGELFGMGLFERYTISEGIAEHFSFRVTDNLGIGMYKLSNYLGYRYSAGSLNAYRLGSAIVESLEDIAGSTTKFADTVLPDLVKAMAGETTLYHMTHKYTFEKPSDAQLIHRGDYAAQEAQLGVGKKATQSIEYNDEGRIPSTVDIEYYTDKIHNPKIEATGADAAVERILLYAGLHLLEQKSSQQKESVVIRINGREGTGKAALAEHLMKLLRNEKGNDYANIVSADFHNGDAAEIQAVIDGFKRIGTKAIIVEGKFPSNSAISGDIDVFMERNEVQRIEELMARERDAAVQESRRPRLYDLLVDQRTANFIDRYTVDVARANADIIIDTTRFSERIIKPKAPAAESGTFKENEALSDTLQETADGIVGEVRRGNFIAADNLVENGIESARGYGCT